MTALTRWSSECCAAVAGRDKHNTITERVDGAPGQSDARSTPAWTDGFAATNRPDFGLIYWPGSRWKGQWAILPPLLLYVLVGSSPQLSVGDAAQYASLDSLLALFV